MQVATVAEVSPSEAPVGADPEMNEQLAEAWKNMQDRVRKLAEMSQGQDYQENIQQADVMANLEAIQKGREKSPKTQRVKQIFNDTLTVIGKVGGIVADAASQVFAPAGQCYNALNFVISAWQDYQSIFDTLNDLFRDCTQFLNRLPEYVKGNMNANLSSVAHKVLELFVDICDHALNLRRSRAFKFMTFMKVAFLSRNEFQEFVLEMDKLTKEESLASVAVTFANSAIAAANTTKTLGLLNESKMEREEKRQEQHDERALMQVLDFDKSPETWDSMAQAPIQTWNAINRKIRQRHVEGTGDWLLTDGLFKNWAKKNGDEPILAFVGKEASGKSYLISAAISHLRTQGSLQGSSKDGNSRCLVAFHFLDNREPNAGIQTLGKSIVWQFAARDASYKQSIASICREGHIEPTNVLSRLLLDNHKELSNIDAVFYIVINKLGSRHNNIDDSLVKFLQGVLRSKNKAVRVLFSATQGTIDRLKTRGITCPTIPIDQKNEVDIRKYIDSRMDRMPVLSNSRQRKVAEVRAVIRDSLYRQTEGNYKLINATLDKIRPLENDQEIHDALKGAGRSMLEHMYDDVHMLNEVRTTKELHEINEIIVWLTFAKERMSPDVITAVLNLKNVGASLRPLEDRFKDKLILFEINEDGFVAFRNEELLSMIPQRGETTSTEQNDDQTVNKGEIAVVQHFLNTVCPPELIQKLDLERHFQQKINSKRQVQICREDKATAHFFISQACVQVLANDPDDGLAALRRYAVSHLMDHLLSMQPARIDTDSKASFGAKLTKLFRDPVAIDNALWAATSVPTLPQFLESEPAVNAIFKWFKDPAVVANTDAQEAGVWSGIEKSKRRKALVEPFVRQMAVHCFRRESPQDVTVAAFRAISNFCDTMEESPDTKAQPGSHGDVEEWCRKRLDVEPDAMWHVQMAMVLRELDQTSEAEKRCKRALDLDKGNWRASLLLAKLVESHTEAIIILEGLTRRFEDDPTLKRDYEKSLSDIAYNLGIRYWALEKFGKAIDSYTESVQLDPSNPSHVLVILSKYDAARKWGEVISLLEKIQSMEKGHLTALVAAMAENPTFHMIILRAMSNANNFDMLDETYGSAISHTKGREYAKSFYLRVFYASALSAYSPATVERVRVLLEDAARDLPYTDLDLPRAFFLVGYRLGTIYLGRAQRAKTENKPELAQEWLQRLVDIVPEQINEDQMRLPLSLFAARYHHVHGDEESALDLVHNTLGMAIELLSDDDASNDKLAFRKILYAVIPFGDVRNAQAALAMLKRAGRFEIPCSCGCGHTWTTPGDMWWCMDCINLVLTTKCMEKVKNPDLANNICDESHTHFHIPEWDAEKMNVSKKHVPYKGKAITMTHWRNKLTQKYRLAGSGTMHNILH